MDLTEIHWTQSIQSWRQPSLLLLYQFIYFGFICNELPDYNCSACHFWVHAKRHWLAYIFIHSDWFCSSLGQHVRPISLTISSWKIIWSLCAVKRMLLVYRIFHPTTHLKSPKATKLHHLSSGCMPLERPFKETPVPELEGNNRRPGENLQHLPRKTTRKSWFERIMRRFECLFFSFVVLKFLWQRSFQQCVVGSKFHGFFSR